MHPSTLIIVGFLFGIGWGGNTTLRMVLVREHFGRSNFGAILGLTMGITAVCGIISPIFAGWVYDTWESYRIAWLVFDCLIFLGLIIISTTPGVKARANLLTPQ